MNVVYTYWNALKTVLINKKYCIRPFVNIKLITSKQCIVIVHLDVRPHEYTYIYIRIFRTIKSL